MNKSEPENYYRVSETDILTIDTLIECLQYWVLSLLKEHPLQTPNEVSSGLDEYEAHLQKNYTYLRTVPANGFPKMRVSPSV